MGVRHKGYSSYSPGRAKNPFNIKLDEVHAGQDYQGYEKLKLSNVIQDPSFLREVLAYEVARNYMHASRANYANLYVNDTLVGGAGTDTCACSQRSKAMPGTKPRRW